jgi:hypothetical protein
VKLKIAYTACALVLIALITGAVWFGGKSHSGYRVLFANGDSFPVAARTFDYVGDHCVVFGPQPRLLVCEVLAVVPAR